MQINNQLFNEINWVKPTNNQTLIPITNNNDKNNELYHDDQAVIATIISSLSQDERSIYEDDDDFIDRITLQDYPLAQLGVLNKDTLLYNWLSKFYSQNPNIKPNWYQVSDLDLKFINRNLNTELENNPKLSNAVLILAQTANNTDYNSYFFDFKSDNQLKFFKFINEN